MTKRFIVGFLTAYYILNVGCNNNDISVFNEVSHDSTVAQRLDSSFKVYKIDSISNCYLVYVSRENKRYKIISEKSNQQNCNMVDTGKYYSFHMIYIIGQVAKGVFKPTCVGIDDKTNVCLEDSITDLCLAKNLRGLCIEKK